MKELPSSTFDELWAKFKRGREYRAAFAAAHAKREISVQIRALMKEHGLTQQDIAELGQIDQASISRAINATNSSITLKTLTRIAAGFDVALVCRFVPFSELPKWFDHLAEEEFQVASFTEENEKLEAAAQEVLAHADKSNVTRMNDFLLKQLGNGQRTPPKAKLPEAPHRGTDFNTPRSGALLPSPGTSEPVPEGQRS